MGHSPALRLLCLCLPLLVTGATARPTEQATSVTLDITSSIMLGRPIFGDILGPYTAGQDLTLTCSVNDPTLVLSWWEGDKELMSLSQVSQELSTASLTLETLSVSDSRRKLSCKVAGTDALQTIFLTVVNVLDIVVDGKILQQDEMTVTIHTGATVSLNCIAQGYTPSSTSWFEDDQKLESQSSRSSYASSNVLTIPGVSTKDSGRRLSCRSDEAEQERTLELHVYGDEPVVVVVDFDVVDNKYTTLKIVYIVVAVAGVVAIFAAVGFICFHKENNEASRVKPLTTKLRKLFKKYAAVPSHSSPKDECQGQSSSPVDV